MRTFYAFLFIGFLISLYSIGFPVIGRAAADQVQEFQKEQTKARQQEQINQTQREQNPSRQKEQLRQLQIDQQMNLLKDQQRKLQVEQDLNRQRSRVGNQFP